MPAAAVDRRRRVQSAAQWVGRGTEPQLPAPDSGHYELASAKGGERAAGILPLIETAKMGGIDPETYLRTILSKIADHPIAKTDKLLPRKLESGSATA
jgi:IS66 C-terminal element